MKVKDLERTANIAWSPATHTPILLAAGTAAQQLDASFNTSAALELYSLNLGEPGLDLELKANIPSEYRFHKLIWGPYGSESSGTIVGGCDSGIIQIYNVGKLLNGDNSLVSTPNKHNGPVHSLDFNPFQGNLLASGAGEAEIYIWDMNNTSTPMTPGAKSSPLEDVVSIQWNRQVQHILASTFVSKCVVWDLRKNEPIIKLTDTVSRIRWKVVSWHPEVPTQLCLASEEDQAPIIQLWDLRFATSPLKTLENHQRGILSMAWCSQDPDLLITSAKDNRIVCWNPNSDRPGGEVLSEIARTNQWNFDVTWCPKNPALIASPSFDGHVSVYSLMGGKTQQIQTTNKIADSFPGMDGYVQAPMQQVSAPVSVDLTKPPKWLKKPVGANFGFGGKLITYINDKSQAAKIASRLQLGEVAPSIVRSVYINQVVTEVELINKSEELEQALEYGNFIDYCKNKADTIDDQHRKYIWHFLRANFESNPRIEILNLLGYRSDEVNDKLNELVQSKDVDGHSNQIDSMDEDNVYSNGNDSLHGDFNNTGIDDFAKISQDYELKKSFKPFKIETGDDPDGLITEAILIGNVEAAVELCMRAKKYTEAIIIAMTGGPELLLKTQRKYLKQSGGYLSMLIKSLIVEDWSCVVEQCDINSWKEALVGVLTHCTDDVFPKLCERLGNRLEDESVKNPKLAQDAQLCYICSGSFDKLVQSWSGNNSYLSNDLQDLIELVMFLQKAIERQGRTVEITGNLADLLSKYAFILASQGKLQTAVNYLGNSQNDKVTELRNRLYISLRQKPATTEPRRTSMRQSFTNYNQTSQFNQNFNQYNTNAVSSSMNQPWQQQTTGFSQPPPKPFSPVPIATPSAPPAQPPRPTSVGSSHGSALPSRSKYKVDPSVQSNTYRTNQFDQNPLAPPLTNQPHMFQPNAISNPVFSSPYSHPSLSSSATTNPLFSTAPMPMPMPPNSMMTPNSMMAPNSMMSPNPMLSPNSMMPPNSVKPLNPMVASNTMMPVNYSLANSVQSPLMVPTSNQLQNQGYQNANYDKPPDMGMSALNVLPRDTASGWNDPPAYNKQRPQVKPDFPAQDPITHPIYGTAPVATNIPYGQNQPFTQNTTYAYKDLQPPSNNFSQSNFNNQAVNANAFNPNQIQHEYNQQPPMAQVEKPQPVQKAPIPEEHIHMQTVFDELRKQCSNASNNAQTKRKLEDVMRKLEVLYDLLRDHKLSSNTLASLHQMVQLIQNGNYSMGLNVHTQLVSGPDFAHIASFMPGLKVLLQCALQLQVYIR